MSEKNIFSSTVNTLRHPTLWLFVCALLLVTLVLKPATKDNVTSAQMRAIINLNKQLVKEEEKITNITTYEGITQMIDVLEDVDVTYCPIDIYISVKTLLSVLRHVKNNYEQLGAANARMAIIAPYYRMLYTIQKYHELF
jgi:Asp-tRNA(Asn)/Glu-tRNA(Gln) amidotransferase C subunit